MAKIGIKLQNGKGEFLKSLNEFEADGNVKPILFETLEEAEMYAQAHEIKNFSLTTYNEKNNNARMII